MHYQLVTNLHQIADKLPIKPFNNYCSHTIQRKEHHMPLNIYLYPYELYSSTWLHIEIEFDKYNNSCYLFTIKLIKEQQTSQHSFFRSDKHQKLPYVLDFMCMYTQFSIDVISFGAKRATSSSIHLVLTLRLDYLCFPPSTAIVTLIFS